MTESGVTIVDFNAMSEAINGYRQNVSNINTILTALQAVQKALAVGNVFTGGAATTVLEAINTYIGVLNKATESLNGLIQVLQSKLESYQQADQQAQSIAASIEQAQWADV